MSNNILFVYLVSLFLGTAAFFTGQALGLNANVIYVVGIATALAVEVHSFLSQRLARGLKEERDSHPFKGPLWVAADRKFQFHLRITVGLVLFSMFNSVAFWISIDRPVTAGDWIASVSRGMALPAFFLLAGFLTPLRTNTAEVVQAAHADMIRTTMKVTLRQFEKRLKAVQKAGANLVPVVATLLDNHGDTQSATQIRLVDAALTLAEGRGSPMNFPMAISAGLPQVVSEPEAPSASTSSGFGVRAANSGMLRQAARECWHLGMTPAEVAAQVGCSTAYASKLVKEFEAELTSVYA
jgi:hypothetical protein